MPIAGSPPVRERPPAVRTPWSGPREAFWLVGLCLLLACGLAGLHVVRPALLARVDLAIYDLLLGRFSRQAASGRVILVEVDERSLAEVGRWPWPRDLVADLLLRLRALGAAVVGLDVLFAEPDAPGGAIGARAAPSGEVSGPAPALSPRDAALATALGQGPFVIGYAFTFDRAVERPCRLHAIGLAHPASDPPGPSVPRAVGVVCNLTPLDAAAVGSGFLNAAPDSDGILRRMPQLVEFQGEVYPSLALATVRTGLAVRQLGLTTRESGWPAVWLDEREIALAVDGSVLVRFRGPAGTLPRVPATDVLHGRVPATAIDGRLVFVGVSALGLGDVVTTPLGELLTGAEVHATVADNLVRGDFIRRPPGAPATELGLVLGAAVSVALGILLLGWPWSLLLAAAGLCLLWLGAGWLLGVPGWFVSPLFPSLALAGAFGVAALRRLVAERRRADESTRELRTAREMMLHALTSLTETRDFETGAHLVRTTRYARALGEALARHPRFQEFLTPETIDLIVRLAPIHDIGKVGVADRTLRKPGPLAADERDEMERHPIYGRDVITRAEERVGVQDDFLLRLAKEIVYSHHERWDGTGYPEGLRGEQIPVAGRLVALVDVYDALTSVRVYKGALPHEEVVEAIVAGRGTQFDPDMVDAFLEIREQWRRIAIEFADEHDEPPPARTRPGTG